MGGRIAPGERVEEGLRREIKEESGLDVTIGRPFFVNEWQPTVRDEHWQIVGIFFECTSETDKVVLSLDHDEYIWVDPKDFRKYDLIGEREPAFESYLNLHR